MPNEKSAQFCTDHSASYSFVCSVSHDLEITNTMNIQSMPYDISCNHLQLGVSPKNWLLLIEFKANTVRTVLAAKQSYMFETQEGRDCNTMRLMHRTWEVEYYEEKSNLRRKPWKRDQNPGLFISNKHEKQKSDPSIIGEKQICLHTVCSWQFHLHVIQEETLVNLDMATWYGKSHGVICTNLLQKTWEWWGQERA